MASDRSRFGKARLGKTRLASDLQLALPFARFGGARFGATQFAFGGEGIRLVVGQTMAIDAQASRVKVAVLPLETSVVTTPIAVGVTMVVESSAGVAVAASVPVESGVRIPLEPLIRGGYVVTHRPSDIDWDAEIEELICAGIL